MTEAINYQLGEYQAEHPDEDIDPGELTLFFYPHSAEYWFEIKQHCDNPRIRLVDSMNDWLNKK